MRVAVGSLNPVKEAVTADALGDRIEAELVTADADSGVSEQPTGHEETVTVARKQGAAGSLTEESITRQSALAHAVAGALGPFLTDRY